MCDRTRRRLQIIDNERTGASDILVSHIDSRVKKLLITKGREQVSVDHLKVHGIILVNSLMVASISQKQDARLHNDVTFLIIKHLINGIYRSMLYYKVIILLKDWYIMYVFHAAFQNYL